jgi:hypothetical protein
VDFHTFNTVTAPMRPIHRFALLLPLLAACSEGPTDPGDYSLDGIWLGREYPLELEVEFNQDGDNHVTGTGEIRGLERVPVTRPDPDRPDDPAALDTVRFDTVPTRSVEVDVSGDWDYPNFELRLRSEGYSDAELAGAWTASDSVRVTLRESGFGNATVVIARQTP